MTELLKLVKVAAEIEQQALFKELSANIKSRDRIGIIGKNGAGKTTLLRLLAGDIAPASGQLLETQGISIRAVEQE
ncbi:ATP-binding cassette domain-containing protein, partial [Bacillus sp. SIMBA_161]